MKIKAIFLQDHSLAVALFALVCWLIPSSVWASVEIDGIYYELNTSSKTAEVVSNPDYYSGTIYIPASLVYQGSTYSVTSIGNEAFGDCTGLTSVDIPNSVTSIDDAAFAYCSSLTEIVVERTTAPTITPSTFLGITATCKVYVPEGSLSAYTNALYWKNFSDIEERTIIATGSCGDNVTYTIYSDMTMVISGRGFMSVPDESPICNNYQSIKKVIIEEGVIDICSGAFSGCSSLTSVTIPSSVTIIGSKAFYDCTGLTSVTIPSNVTFIESYAFSGCTGLTSIQVSPSNTKYDSRNNCNAIITTSTNTLVAGCKNSIIPTSVTSISLGAFFECTGLTSVTIPSSVTSIGPLAFSGCSGLTSLTILSGVTIIGSSAFSGCSGLTSVTIPSSVTSIERSTFSDCSSLTSIQVSSSNTKYDSRNNCNAIIETSTNTIIAGCKNSIIPSSVTSIGYEAFSGCADLSSVTIPSSVTTIGFKAFYDCTGLTSVTIPSNVTSIGNYAFSGCSGLTSIQVSPSNTKYDSRNNCNAIIETSSKSLIFGCKNTIIPSGVTSIKDGAFYNCTCLTSVAIPSSVNSIRGAFYGCTGLTSIIVERATPIEIFWREDDVDDVFVFSDVNFSACTLYVPAGSRSAYESEEGWWRFRIREYVPEAQVDGIYYNLNMTEKTAEVVAGENKYFGNVTIPSSFECYGSTFSVTTIGEEAFLECFDLTSMVIPSSVTNIDWNAFSGCSGLTSVEIPNSVTEIGACAFQGCTGLTFVEIPNSVSEICDYTFTGCTGLTSLTIPNSVTIIGEEAFSGCTALTSISLPNSVTNICLNAFSGCTGLTSLTIPESVTEIGLGGFGGCTGLTSIVANGEIPAHLGMNSNGQYVMYEYAFMNVDKTNCTLYVPIGCKSVYENANGWSEFQNIVERGILATGSCGDNVTYTIYSDMSMVISGTGTIRCENNCKPKFPYYQSIERIIIEDGVTNIGQWAFSNCTSLTSIKIPGSVSAIGIGAFIDCANLTSLTIENGVKTIQDCAFVRCSSLSLIVIPSSVTNIEVYDCTPFGQCPNLTSIIVDANNEIYDSRDNCNAIIKTSTNTLVEGCINTVIPSSVTEIGSFAFSGMGLTSVDIPNSVNKIGYAAFEDCTGLTALNIPSSVTDIEMLAFVSCTGLGSVTIPKNVTSIGERIFERCTGLNTIIVDGNNETYDSRDNCNAIIETSTNTLIASCGNTFIPNSVTSIGSCAFMDCTNLTSVTIPSSVMSIGDNAFGWCTGLTSITVEHATPISLPYSAFGNVDKSNCILYVPFGSKSAYETAEYWSEFQNIEESPLLIDNLYYSHNISDNTAIVEKIADKNYSGSINIPESIEYAGNTYAVTEIGLEAFSGCTGLTSVVIPNSVTRIIEGAFYGCVGLASVEIPNSVTYIDHYTFDSCTGLTSVDIPNSVTNIGFCAFGRCTGLTSVNIPNSVTRIGDGAFVRCIGMTSINIPNSVIEIGVEAFENCTGLTSITVEHETPISLHCSVFENVDKTNCTLYVPVGSKTAYENAEGWNEFENIVEIGEEPDTDISEYDNIVYIEGAEALVGQQIRLSLKMNNTIASTGFQCDVYLPEGVTAAQDEDGFYLMDISEERTTSKKTDFSSSVLQPDGGLRFMCSSTKSYTFSGNEGEVAYLMVDIDPNMEEGTYPLILRNIEISDANSNPYRVSYVKTTLTVNTYTLGDANNDGSIGVSDFTAIANYIMGTPPASFVEKAADVNVDGVISVSDLTGEANIILYGTVTPNASHAKARNEVTAKYANIGANDVTANSDKEFSVAITIDGNYAYSGYQFDVTLPEGMMVKDVYGQTKASNVFMSGMIDDNTLRVLCASTMGETTESSVVNLTLVADSEGSYIIDIDNAIISANSSTYAMSNSSFLIAIDNDATGISAMSDEASSNDVVYDLTGRKLMSNGNKSSLQKGIYIINGHKITK